MVSSFRKEESKKIETQSDDREPGNISPVAKGMDRLNSDCLMSIFKYLDLPSRLQASKTCKLWRELLSDPALFMDDISDVVILGGNEPKSFNVESVASIFSNIHQCNQLILRDTTGSILSDAAIKEHLFRFGNVRLFLHKGFYGQYAEECLETLRESPLITSLSITATIVDQSPLDFSDLNHLERLEIDFTCKYKWPNFQPNILFPPSLRGLATNWRHPPIDGANRFRNTIQSCPLLEDLKIGGWHLNERVFPRFLNLIRNRLINLRRVHFFNVAFDSKLEMNEHPIDGLPLEWIRFEACTNQWIEAAEILIKASNVKTVVMTPKFQELPKIYFLEPLIKAKKATLELTFDPDIRYEIFGEGPIDLNEVLTKLNLIWINDSRYLKSFFMGNDFNKLTEINLGTSIPVRNTNLAVVAECCQNLEKLSFKPDLSSGQYMMIDKTIQPFFQFWDNRKSKQLSIEYLRTDLTRWFQGGGDQENGVLEDGKCWVQYRNWANKEGGGIRVVTRMVIQDEDGKKMVIRDYDKDLGKKLQICLVESPWREGCSVKVMGSR